MFTELDTRWYADGFPTKHPLIVDAIRTMVAKTPIEGYVAATIAVRDFDITGQLPNIAAPLLLITGADDKATPLSEAKFIRRNTLQMQTSLCSKTPHIWHWLKSRNSLMMHLSALSRALVRGRAKETVSSQLHPFPVHGRKSQTTNPNQFFRFAPCNAQSDRCFLLIRH